MEKSSGFQMFKVTFVGLIVNILLTVFKFLAGIFGKSSAMIADATHSLSDLVSDIIVLVFVKIANKPVDDDHRYGHGKFETFSAFIVGLILAFVGIGILWDAGVKINEYVSGNIVQASKNIALIAAAVSIFVKEILFWYTIIAAKKYNSQMLRANAWHHRTDAFSSIATLLGIGGAMFLGGKWQILDPIAAVIVSILIVKVAYKIVIPAANDLLEKSLPEKTMNEIFAIISSVKHVQQPHGLRTRKIGNHVAIEFHIKIDRNMSVFDSHEVTLVIEEKLKVVFGRESHIVIHVDPA